MQNEPVYRIRSVDHALHLAAILAQEGPLRLSEAAQRLGVARSTAHRLLTMLVYRGFAEQDPDRRYRAGPVLRGARASEPVADLRRVALPHLRALTERVGETTNVMVVDGDDVRFVASVECAQVLRVGEREGRVLPAHLASGGRAVLAGRPEDEVRARYERPDSPVADVDALLRDLRRFRRQGFAINDGRTETGLTAIGVAVPGPGAAALSIALPTARYRRDRLTEWVAALTDAAAAIAHATG
ncbi:IclR family transcriptional regulator [Actinomycetospora soli]|uniref:IclR family transcriptional regulator n=1 Tax=Actinomycetospora soli TaxID=2893887 RepID=UPI001E436116|nr:IclR family transcriptional regulator [Actinomycetospora soli]MCD2190580.1 IclR family transcriptional regulator [Actinomycetospora soli]